MGDRLTPEWLNDYAGRAYSVSAEHGWWEGVSSPEEVPVPTKLLLIASEVSEAVEDLRRGKVSTYFEEGGKPVGYPSEIADVAIRTLELIHALGGRVTDISWRGANRHVSGEVSYMEMTSSISPEDLRVELLMMLHQFVVSAWEFHLSDARTFRGFSWLNAIVALCALLLEKHEPGADLFKRELELKLAFNKTRPHKHGGKLFG